MTQSANSIDHLQRLDEAEFIALLGTIYEHSPWVAQRAWSHRPFHSRSELQSAMRAALDAATPDEQRGVMRAHPELAGKAALGNALGADSAREQRGAGLDQCSPDELLRLQEGNRAYAEKFGFPFIVAVKGLGRADILAALAHRLGRSRTEEFAEAMTQIHRIAAFRLQDKIAG